MSNLETLNKEQYSAVTTINGPLLIIAGAGTGKTTTLIHRVAHMIENGIAPESILLLTFTNAAAAEMMSRAEKLSNANCSKITACTYHSFCAQMLRKYGRSIGILPDFTILVPSDVRDAIGFIKAEDEKYKLRGFPNNMVIANIFSSAVNKNKTIAEILEEEKYFKIRIFVEELTTLQKEFAIYKKQRNLLDYDDLLVKFYELLQIEPVRERIEQNYRYIMVDEYQDTNNLQERIVFAMRKKNRNLAVVGDDYQSIYAFRGSDINNILDFNKNMPGCKEVIIDTNYRSTQEILDLANCMMKMHANFGFPKNMKANGKHGGKPTLYRALNQDGEVDYILENIEKRRESGVPLHEIAILERSSMSSFRLEARLNYLGIPYEKRGGLKFMDHRCVIDMIAYLRCLANPYDELAWFRILQLHPGIGDTYSKRISQGASSNLQFLLDDKYAKRKFYPELNLLYQKIEEVKQDEFIQQFDKLTEFYHDVRYRTIELMETEDEGVRTEEFEKLGQDMVTISALKDLIIKYDTAIQFLDAIALDSTPEDKAEDKLIISTIHSAKGLEWNTVFIMDCVDGVFPNINPDDIGSPDDMEELRCFYVAVTRAKERLHIICPEWVMFHGRGMYGQISHYLDKCELTYLMREERKEISSC